MRVFINPGHAPNGIPDSGAINPDLNLRECDIALDVGNLLKQHLTDDGFDVMLLQDDSLELICDESNRFDSDIFISIHCNAFNTKAHGTESWYFFNSSDGYDLAEHIQRKIVNAVGTADRGIKPAQPGKNGLYVLTNTNATAVLIELAFIDNYEDALLLKKDPDVFAGAIADAIIDYCEAC